MRWDFGYCGHYWPIVPAPDDRWWWLWRNWWNKDWQGKPKYSEKTCPSATLCTTNPTWLDPGLNPGRRGGKPATNRLSYGATYNEYYSKIICSINKIQQTFMRWLLSIFNLVAFNINNVFELCIRSYFHVFVLHRTHHHRDVHIG
jgi:hypothetical protein